MRWSRVSACCTSLLKGCHLSRLGHFCTSKASSRKKDFLNETLWGNISIILCTIGPLWDIPSSFKDQTATAFSPGLEPDPNPALGMLVLIKSAMKHCVLTFSCVTITDKSKETPMSGVWLSFTTEHKALMEWRYLEFLFKVRLRTNSRDFSWEWPKQFTPNFHLWIPHLVILLLKWALVPDESHWSSLGTAVPTCGTQGRRAPESNTLDSKEVFPRVIQHVP